MRNVSKVLLSWIRHVLVLGAALSVQGCGGYGHVNGQKVAEIVKADLIRFQKCASSVDCTNMRLVEYGEGINSLHLNVVANLTRAEVAEITSSVIQKAPLGSIRLSFSDPSKKVNVEIEISL